MPSNRLILSSPFVPAFKLPSIRVFSIESVLTIRWPKCCSFSFSISPSNEYSGLISFRMDCWISLLSKGLARVFSSTTVLRRSAFLIVQLSHPYMTTGKTIALTRWTFVGKVMSLLFNMLSAVAAKLQLCPTLCDPMDSSPPVFSCPWDSLGKNTGVGCHFLLQYVV